MIDFAGKRTEFKALADSEIYPSQSPALNFVDTILGKTPNGSPGELGLASMEIIEAACVSAKTGRAETIRAVQAKNGNMPGPANFHATAAPNFLA
jgi:predicted dehydrogenase